MNEEVKEMEEKEVVEVVKEEVETPTSMVVANIGELAGSRKSNVRIYSTLDFEKDKKLIFNLENNCDYKINDCKGESIRVVDVLIKSIQKKLEEPIVNEETGEVQEFEFKKVCILIDDQGKSYVTASKLFTMQMARYLETFGVNSIKNGLDIRIIEKPIKNSSNKSLGFELI